MDEIKDKIEWIMIIINLPQCLFFISIHSLFFITQNGLAEFVIASMNGTIEHDLMKTCDKLESFKGFKIVLLLSSIVNVTFVYWLFKK